MKKAYFTIGLPGAGKSTAIEIMMNEELYSLISADNIRLSDVDYDPADPSKNHEKCVKLAEEEVYKAIENGTETIVMDGGGINKNYTKRIIEKCKSCGYKTTLIYVDTPEHICIARNEKRKQLGDRFVPTEVIVEKSRHLTESFERLAEIVDCVEHIQYFSDEYVFVDMDGTIVEYQPATRDYSGNVDFVNYNKFKNPMPVKEVIEKLKANFYFYNIFILSASPNSICTKDKLEWLKIHFPEIPEDNIFFCGNKDYKHVMLDQLMEKLNIKPTQVTLIDDYHDTLSKATALGVNAIHPSRFLARY